MGGLKDRILEFISYKGLTPKALERNAGLSNGAVSKMGDDTRSKTLDSISTAFPDLNMIWLRTGVGDMLNFKSTDIGVQKQIANILKHAGLNAAEFSIKIGTKTPQAIYDLQSGKTKNISPSMANKILSCYPEINKIWLLTGEGEMLNPENGGASRRAIEHEEYKMIPLIGIDSVGGMHSNNDITDTPEYIEKMIPFIKAQDGDVAIVQSGESMSPTIPPGSILQIRKVENWAEYFGYGSIFVILLKDGRRLTKEVKRYDADPKKYVWCVSHNPNVSDEELPLSMIAGVWKVVKVLTDKGW